MNFDWTNIDQAQSQMDQLADENDNPEHSAIDHWTSAGEDAGPFTTDEIDEWAIDEPTDNHTSEVEPECDAIAPSAEAIASMLARLNSAAPTTASPMTKSPPATVAEPKNLPQPTHSSPTASVPDVSIQSLDPELRDAFLDDARSCVGSMEAALLKLESEPTHAESLNQIGRELHTLKGASASVGLTHLAGQLHQLEDRLHAHEIASTQPCFDSLLKSIDWIRMQISGSGNQSDMTQAIVSQAIVSQAIVSQANVSQANSGSASGLGSAKPEGLKTIASSPSFNDEGTDDESVRIKSSQLNRLMDMLAELVMLRNRRETEVSQLQDIYHELIGGVSKMRLLSNESNQQVTESSSLQLSEIANDVLEVAQHVRDCARPVAEGNAAVSQFIRQFRQELIELRRTPVSGLFQRLQRVVRDAAHAESKSVQLKLSGEDAGIERSLQQRLYEPLLHIVRNSVCHGIETAEVRARAGKPAVGTITLEAKSGPDLFVIEIRDDGNGLDYEAIRRRGIERGLLDADQSVTRQELSQLIFQPGFSTRDAANQAAGRGVGMDVVASTLLRMRGWLEIDSEPQRGTRIRLSFPLPSVIQHAMVFRSANQLFALPMQSVHSIGDAAKSECSIPFAEILGDRRAPSSAAPQKIVLSGESSPSSNANIGQGRVTLLVDEIIGPEEVVVRPLPALLKPHPFCCGATLSGMGRTVIFLDARGMIQSHRHLIQSNGKSALCSLQASQEHAALSTLSIRPHVLVVDDSISARKRVVRSLSRYPIDVTEACDGKKAVELLKNKRFAAVFSDLEMPHVNGLELLAEINSTDTDTPPPVVIISSRHEKEYADRAKELGVSSYLIKPLTDDALDRALAKIPSIANFPGLKHGISDLS